MSAHLLLLHSISVFKLNGKYSRSSMGAGAPRGASKATKCDGNEGAVGNWFLLRGWQMLMLTDRESDYSELRRWTSACVSWLPLQQNHSQSHLHKSHPGTVWKQHYWAKVVMPMKGCLSWKSATSDHKGCMHTWKKHGCLRPWTSVTLILTNYSNCISVTSELLAALTEV